MIRNQLLKNGAHYSRAGAWRRAIVDNSYGKLGQIRTTITTQGPSTNMNPSTVPHSGFGLLQIQGPDAIKFLQGQVTCDTNTLNTTNLQHSAHCTAKGRMIANFDAFTRDEQTVWFRLPADNIEPLQQSLAKYIVFSKATLTDLCANYKSLGIIGDNVMTWLNQHDIDFGDREIVESHEHLFIKLDDTRVEVWRKADSPEIELIQSLTRLDDNESWKLGDIRMGKGWITQTSSDAFLPQDLNLQTDTINGVNFKKGCYTGQEIVARMHYKGKLKRHLYRFNVNTIQDISIGAELVIGDKPQSVGTVVNTAISDQGRELLAVTTETGAHSGELHITGAATDKLTLAPLPYAITNEA